MFRFTFPPKDCHYICVNVSTFVQNSTLKHKKIILSFLLLPDPENSCYDPVGNLSSWMSRKYGLEQDR